MTQTLLIAFGLMVAFTTQAASFECGKAAAKVEKLICADAGLSKLDEELDAAYKTALQDEKQVEAIRQAQKRWMKGRNACTDVPCLNATYTQRVTQLKSGDGVNINMLPEIRAKEILKASPLDAAPFATPLSPFTYTQDSSLPGQRTEPVCRDFRNYLNHPRSNKLFKPDGTLVRESEQFKSISWEALNKAQYRNGFVANTDAANSSVRAEYLKRYADPEWILQRTPVQPYEYELNRQQPERWLYRLVQLRPYTRNMEDPASKVELPTWFHFGSVEWLGYADGHPLVGNVTALSNTTAGTQWIVYAGITYSVGNSTYGDGKGAVPQFIGLDIHKLIVDSSGQSFLSWVCAFVAKNKE